MKKIIIPLMTALMVSVGCNRNFVEIPTEGSLSLQVAPSEEGFQIVTKANDQVEDFIIDIYRPHDRWSQSYVYGDIKGEMISLAAASYKITARSPQTADAAWDLPIYSASKEFAVKAGEVTPVSLKCELTNVKVTIELGDNFKRELSTYDVTVSNGKGSLTWAKSGMTDDFAAGKAGYFTVAPLEVRVTGHRAIDDSKAETSLMISDVVAKNHHIIRIDAKVTGQIGGEDTDGDGNPDSGISITIDDSVNQKDENVYVDGLEEIPVEGGDDSDEGEGDDEGDAPVPPAPEYEIPTISWLTPGNTADMSTALTITDDAAAFDYNMLIHAPEGIKSFLVNVKSAELGPLVVSTMTEVPLDENGVAVMDMIGNPKLVAAAQTMGLGLPVGDQLENVTDPVEFRLNNLLVLIPELAANGTTHVFTLDLTDNKDQHLVKDFTFIVSK